MIKGGLGLLAGLSFWHPARAAFAQQAGGSVLDWLEENVFRDLSFSEGEQAQFGQALNEPVQKATGGVYRNGEVQLAIRDFALPLFNSSFRRSLGWDIAVIDNDLPMAWSLPGGKVGLFKGLLRYIETPDQLAAVIAHEIGHIENGDLLAPMKRPAFLASLTPRQANSLYTLLSVKNSPGLSSPNAARILLPQVVDLVLKGYAMEAEYRADERSLSAFRQSGHDPAKGAEIWPVIASLTPEGTEKTTCLFAGHAAAQDRFERVEKAAQSTNQALLAPANRGFEALKTVFPTRHHYSPARPNSPAGPKDNRTTG